LGFRGLAPPRLSLAVSDETLDAGLERLRQALPEGTATRREV
jgi:hypothetical protein